MDIPQWIRSLHRWTSLVFTLTIIANFAVRAKGSPPDWVTYAPLVPLALLLLSGTYLFIGFYLKKPTTL